MPDYAKRLGVVGHTGVLNYDATSVDAFGNPVSVSPVGILDCKHIDGLRPDVLYTKTEGGGSVTFERPLAAARMTVASTGDRVVRQTRRYLPYESGRSFKVTLTATPVVGNTAGVRWRAGFFDDEADKTDGTKGNGLFFQYEDGQWSFVVRYESVDTVIPQNAWNGEDFALDASGRPLLWLDFGWLSVRGVRFGTYDGGRPVLLHDEDYTNRQSEPFIARATLPVRYEITSTGGAGSSDMVCFLADSYGYYKPSGVSFNTRRDVDVRVEAGEIGHLISIRLKDGFQRRSIIMDAIHLMCVTAGNSLVELWRDTQLPGATWNDVNAEAGSGMEVSVDATTIDFTTARRMHFGFVSNNQDQFGALPNTDDIPSSDMEGNPQIITLVVRPHASAETYYAGLAWKEII